MTGRGGARPTTTPKSYESAAPLPRNAANQATRGPRFEGMERMFGKTEDSPSVVGPRPVRRGRFSRQAARYRSPASRSKFGLLARPGGITPSSPHIELATTSALTARFNSNRVKGLGGPVDLERRDQIGANRR